MSVIIRTTDNAEFRTTPAEMARLSGSIFTASDRVPGVSGEGFGLAAWYAAFTADKVLSTDTSLARPTHLIVRAADEFQAVVPWNQLVCAFFLFASNGGPLAKDGPLRLYVPDGSSACLNVKSVHDIRFAADPDLGEEAMYGFQNEISPARMSQGFKNRV